MREISRKTLAEAYSGTSTELSVVIADDDTVRELNHLHRGIDKTTDVLSFAFDNQGEYYGEGEAPSEWSEDTEFIMPPGQEAGLGEVIISYPQAVRQAEEVGRSVTDEVANLLTHGILHLLGHDHMEPDEEAVMKAKENAVLASVYSEKCELDE